MSTMTNAELLILARKQVFAEYVGKAKDLESWLVESEKAWKEEGITIKYPSFPIYPNDGEIEERAELLKQYLSQKLDKANTEAKPQEEPKVEEVLVPEITVTEPIEESVPIIKPPTTVYYKHPKKRWEK